MKCSLYILYGLPSYGFFYRNVKKDKYVRELDFSALSVKSLPRQYHDFKC